MVQQSWQKWFHRMHSLIQRLTEHRHCYWKIVLQKKEDQSMHKFWGNLPGSESRPKADTQPKPARKLENRPKPLTPDQESSCTKSNPSKKNRHYCQTWKHGMQKHVETIVKCYAFEPLKIPFSHLMKKGQVDWKRCPYKNYGLSYSPLVFRYDSLFHKQSTKTFISHLRNSIKKLHNS